MWQQFQIKMKSNADRKTERERWIKWILKFSRTSFQTCTHTPNLYLLIEIFYAYFVDDETLSNADGKSFEMHTNANIIYWKQRMNEKRAKQNDIGLLILKCWKPLLKNDKKKFIHLIWIHVIQHIDKGTFSTMKNCVHVFRFPASSGFLTFLIQFSVHFFIIIIICYSFYLQRNS